MALVGDNGAGKSTLIKCIAGTHSADSGEIVFEGREVKIHGPKDAGRLGIEVVYQDLALCDNLDVVQNVYLGREAEPVPDLERGGDGADDVGDAEVACRDHDPVGAPAGRDALGRPAPVGGRRESRSVELEARHPRRADGRPRRRADRAGARARAPARRAGAGRDPHFAQPPRRVRDGRPHHRASARPERRRCSTAARRRSRRSSRRSPPARRRRWPASRRRRRRPA